MDAGRGMMRRQRLRVTFTKGSQLKYISHLDLSVTWERALRRADVPLTYSQGHNPQAKLQLASGLPLGYTGSAEIMDIILAEPMPPAELTRRVGPVLPDGLTIVAVEEVPYKSPSLQSTLRQALYRVTIETSLPRDELTERVAKLLAAEHLEQQRVRKGREETFDLRALVSDVQLETVENNQAVLSMQLSAGQRGNVRPDAVLEALGLANGFTQIDRKRLLFEFDSA
jgi:radical SAM-linked protein